jgi:signal transduction histidine kinase
VQVSLEVSGRARPAPAGVDLSAFRIIQEALTNVVKHAPGARAAIDLAVSANRVRLEVADDGGPAGGGLASGGPAGGGPAGNGRQASPGTGHGIVGMRERIGAFGGRLAAGPGADRGYRVIAEIPIEGAL